MAGRTWVKVNEREGSLAGSEAMDQVYTQNTIRDRACAEVQ